MGEDSFISLANDTEVVKMLPNGKASDEVHPEMLKTLNIVGLSGLAHLCSDAQRSGTVPTEWRTVVVVPIFKEGD